jgi:hypothetical protein
LDSDLSSEFPEYFVSGIYNFAISNGLKIKMLKGVMSSFGTPKELNNYLGN